MNLHLQQCHHPTKTIPVRNRGTLEALSPSDLSHSRIVGFCTDIVVPARILDATGFGAYNFHPGPPLYPGWGPANFAIHDGARRYGATAHVMAPKVDTGDIVGTNMFDVPVRIALPQLEEMAFTASLQLFLHFAPHLAADERPLPVIQAAWGHRRCTRRAAAALYGLSPDHPDDDVAERLRALAAA